MPTQESLNSAANPRIGEKFYQVRVKSLEFLQKSAIAIYFFDFTATI